MRPRSVTLVAVGVITLGLVNIYRAITLYNQIALQLELGVTLDPRVRLVGAIVWAILLIAAAAALWFRKPWSRTAVPVLLLLYAIYRLFLGGIIAESAYTRQSQILTAIVYAFLTTAAAWLLHKKASQSYFCYQTVIKNTDSQKSSSTKDAS